METTKSGTGYQGRREEGWIGNKGGGRLNRQKSLESAVNSGKTAFWRESRVIRDDAKRAQENKHAKVAPARMKPKLAL